MDKHKEAELLLGKNHLRLESFISNFVGIIFRWVEGKDKADFMSDGCHELSGFQKDEFLDDDHIIDWKDIIHPNDLYLVNWEHEQCYSSGKKYQLTYRILSKYNGIRWVNESGSLVVNDETSQKKIEGFITDITDKKKNEDQVIHAILETEDKERRRIAKELHDGLGQTLTSALMNLRAFKKKLESETSVSFSLLDKGLLQLMDAAVESRNIAHNIMPKSIDDFGYVLTVESMLEGLSESGNTTFSFYNNLNDRIPKIEVELALYRITQESINNIIKHSKASEAMIQLIENDEEYILTIEDNGVGFSNEHLKHSFGLTSMKNRASSISGLFNIDSTKENGTIITVQVSK